MNFFKHVPFTASFLDLFFLFLGTFFNWAIPGLFFFIFLFSGLQLTDNYVRRFFLPILGFEPEISGVGSNHSADCTTTTALGTLFDYN